MAKLKQKTKKELPPAALRRLSDTPTPLFIAAPLFLWTIAAFVLYYTAENNRIWVPISELIPDFQLLKFSMLFQYAKNLAIISWLLLLGAGLGFFTLNKLRFEFDSKAEAAALSLGLGWGIMALGMLALGLAHLWYDKFIVAVLMGLSWPAVRMVRELSRISDQINKPWSAGEILLGCFLAGLVCFNILGSFIPEIFYDSLVYHLAVPDLYRLHHGMIPTPQNIYSAIPMLVEMLYGIGLVLGSDEISHLINAAFGFFSALLLIGLFNRVLKSRLAGLIAAVMFYSLTIVSILSWKAAIELGWTYLQFAAVYALIVRINGGPQQRKWTWLAALFTGLAMGTKYPAWPALGILGALFAIFKYRENPALPRWWIEPLQFAAIAIATLCLWPIKNVLFYGNPVYPFLCGHFAGPGTLPNLKGLLGDAKARDLEATFLTWNGLSSYITHPWTLLSQRKGKIDDLGVLPLLVIPYLFCARFKDSGLRFLLWAAVLFWLSWSLSSTQARFFVTQLPLICALLVLGFNQYFDPWYRRIVYAAVVFAAACHLVWSLNWFKIFESDAVVFGSESKRSYLSRTHSSYAQPPYTSMEFMNQKLPLNAKVLFLGESRGFRMERDYIAASVFDTHPLMTWLSESWTPEDLLRHFKNAGITHILFNLRLHLEYKVKQGLDTLPANDRESKVYEAFKERYLKVLFEEKPQTDDPAPNELYIIVYEVV